MNIIQAINDDRLFRPFLGDDLTTWNGWAVLLRALYGLPIRKKSIEFFRQATGRDPSLLPQDGFDCFLGLTGRRSGKSRITSVVAAFEAAIGRRWERCAAGETPVVAVISPRKQNSKVIRNYVREIFEAPLLRGHIVSEQADGFTLKNKVVIQIIAGDGGVAVRGATCICVCLDEVCFHGVEDDSKIKSDSELVRACRPSLATTSGKLLAISSPYARRGWAYEEHARAFGNDSEDDILVVNGPSRLFNETLPQRVVDSALRRDLQGAKSEWLGEFRDALSAYIGRDLVESCVIEDRQELMPRDGIRYWAACDMSAGRHDASVLGIMHREDGTFVLDVLRHFPAPHEPHVVVGEMAVVCRKYGVTSVVGDKFAGNWCSDAWKAKQIRYRESEHSASEAYCELLPVINTPDALELLENEVLVNELCNLERRVRPNGKDLITHPPGLGHHDDAANVLGLLVAEASHKKIRVGSF